MDINRWTTLLIPKSIEIVSDMRGFELDMQSFGFRKLMEDNAAVVNAGEFHIPRLLKYYSVFLRPLHSSYTHHGSEWRHGCQHSL